MHKAFFKAIFFLLELSHFLTWWLRVNNFSTLHFVQKDRQRNSHIICNKWELKVISETGQLRGLVIESRAFSLPGVQTVGNEHVINTSLERSAVSMRLCQEWQEGIHAWTLVTGSPTPLACDRGAKTGLCYLGQLQPRCHGTFCQGRLSPCVLAWAAAVFGSCPERTSWAIALAMFAVWLVLGVLFLLWLCIKCSSRGSLSALCAGRSKLWLIWGRRCALDGCANSGITL